MYGLVTQFSGDDYEHDFKKLKALLANMGVSVPTLYKQYKGIADPGGVWFGDFGSDPDFSDAIDGLVMVDLARLKSKKYARYLGESFTACEHAGMQD